MMSRATENADSISGNSDSLCPSCERFIGPADVCHYCGADSAREPLLRKLRYAALLLGIGGLAWLYLMTINRDIPVVTIGGVTPMMDFACVRIDGTVERTPYVSRQAGTVDYVSFSVHDGSGRMRIVAYDSVAMDLVEKELIPTKGALVNIAGILNVRSDRSPRLRLVSADQLHVMSQSP